MNEANAAIERLKHIQQLWVELGRKKSNTPEYAALMTKIRIQSAEYQALIAPSKPLEKSK